MNLSDWRGQLTFFAGMKRTEPEREMAGGFGELCDSIAPPDGPVIVESKDRVRYFVPTLLKVAPLTGKTRERAEKLWQPLDGKQRSANHVTTASLLVLDVDGAPGTEVKDGLRLLRATGIAFLAYSSFSHGAPDKAGVRCRVIVPIDRHLGPNEYFRGSRGLAALYFNGQVDQTSARMHQQQGVWATHPTWRHKAFRFAARGSLADSEALLAACPDTVRRTKIVVANPFAAACGPSGYDEERVRTTLRWADPEPHDSWINTGLYLKAAYGDEPYELWRNWSNTAPESVTVGNVGEYALDTVWDRLDPYLPAEAAAGSLFAAARDAAHATARKAASAGVWTERDYEAVTYLMTYHHQFFLDNYEVAP